MAGFHHFRHCWEIKQTCLVQRQQLDDINIRDARIDNNSVCYITPQFHEQIRRQWDDVFRAER